MPSLHYQKKKVPVVNTTRTYTQKKERATKLEMKSQFPKKKTLKCHKKVANKKLRPAIHKFRPAKHKVEVNKWLIITSFITERYFKSFRTVFTLKIPEDAVHPLRFFYFSFFRNSIVLRTTNNASFGSASPLKGCLAPNV